MKLIDKYGSLVFNITFSPQTKVYESIFFRINDIHDS